MSNPLAGRYGPYDPNWPPVPTWCTRCEIHRATSKHPLCPVCADEREKNQQP